jgi:hypothetical protein
MAGRKLTDEEKAHYNWKMSLNRAAKEKEKAEKLGQNPKPKVNVRSADEIMADIEKVKQDPKFQKKMEKYKAAQAAEAAKGTQANHHVTAGKDVTKAIAKGASNGVLGLAVAGMAAFNTEAKRIADMKNQIN